MKKKERVDYIFFSGKKTRWKRWQFQTRIENGIAILRVEMPDSKGMHSINRLARKLKKYDISQAVLDGDAKTAEWLGLKNMLFQARKQELIENRKLIFEYMQKIQGEGKRKHSSMAIVINSGEWNCRDLLLLLVEAKDYYEEITLVLKDDFAGKEYLAESMYEDWGIVLHLISEKEKLEKKQDFILFLLETGERKILLQYSFQNAYLVSDTEAENLKRYYMMPDFRQNHAKKRAVYSGLVYEKEMERLPYRIGVNLAAQKPMLYQKFHVSIVAIYQIE